MYSYKKVRTCFCMCYDLYYDQAMQIEIKKEVLYNGKFYKDNY